MSRTSFAISEVRCQLGEGPLWDASTSVLYVVDIPNCRLHKLSYELATIATVDLGKRTTALTCQADGSILTFEEDAVIARIDSRGLRTVVLDGLPDEKGGLFNDVIADRFGRVLCGTQPVLSRPGRLYCIQPDLTWRVLLDDVQEPNGLAFSPDGSALYFSDSGAQTIWRFAYDGGSGSLSEPRVFFKATEDTVPDGLTVDTDGFVWCALWNGASVICVAPSGRLIKRVQVPAYRPTSLTFGGPAFDTLFVTTAIAGDTLPHRSAIENGGAIFAVRGVARGRAEFHSRLAL